MRAKLPRTRPLRGKADDTRARLVAAASALFERDGYHGTDSNKIAAAAGYAAGTFYKHFADKRAVLLAAYEAWLEAEWSAVEAELGRSAPARERAARVTRLAARMHARGRGMRAALLSLLPTDAEVRSFYRAKRRRQLDALATLRARGGGAARRARERDALLLFTLERSCDALANHEHRDLALSRAKLLAELAAEVEAALR
jgi:AcrR family transcriptional regulator